MICTKCMFYEYYEKEPGNPYDSDEEYCSYPKPLPHISIELSELKKCPLIENPDIFDEIIKIIKQELKTLDKDYKPGGLLSLPDLRKYWLKQIELMEKQRDEFINKEE